MNKSYNNFKYLGIIFIVLAIIFAISFPMFLIIADKFGNRLHTSGIIEKITDEGIDVVYTVDGKEIHTHLNEEKDGYSEKQEIIVFYDKDNIEDAFTTRDYGLESIFMAFPFAAVSMIFFIKYHKNNKRYKSLFVNGTIINAKITNITRMGPITFIINCEFDGFDGKKHYYHSDVLNFNPVDILNYKGIDKMPVYVDVNDLNNYYVDISIIRW